jgi:hypothetical protein
MLHLLATTLTVCSVLAHAVTGCCWHHGHGHSSSSTACAPVPEAACSHGHSERADHDDHAVGQPADPADEGEHRHIPCGDPRCEFVAGSHGPSLTLKQQWVDSGLVTHCSASTAEQVSFVECGLVRFKAAPATAVEHCALTQVWRL